MNEAVDKILLSIALNEDLNEKLKQNKKSSKQNRIKKDCKIKNIGEYKKFPQILHIIPKQSQEKQNNTQKEKTTHMFQHPIPSNIKH